MRSIQTILHADLEEVAAEELDRVIAALVTASLAVDRLGDAYVLVSRRLHEDIDRFSDERVRRRKAQS